MRPTQPLQALGDFARLLVDGLDRRSLPTQFLQSPGLLRQIRKNLRQRLHVPDWKQETVAAMLDDLGYPGDVAGNDRHAGVQRFPQHERIVLTPRRDDQHIQIRKHL